LCTNSVGDQDRDIPVMPFVWLYKFARRLRDSNRSTPRHVRAGKILGWMFDQEKDYSYEAFQNYHAFFEGLRQVMRDESKVTLAELYPKAIHNKKWDPASVSLESPVLGEYHFLPRHHWPGTAGQQYFNIPGGIKIGDIIVPGSGNQGFDTCIVQQRDGKPFFLCIQNKWSDIAASTATSLKQIQTAWESTVTDFSRHFSGKSELGKLFKNKSQLCLVFACYRKFQQDVEQKADSDSDDLPPQVLVFDRKSLKQLYGPTLVSRPQFWMSKSDMNAFT